MLITEKEKLKRFYSENRLWQGIPGIAITKGGIIYSVYYGGGIKEEYGNCVMLVKSTDGGITFSQPIAVAYNGKIGRCYDPVVWVDPKNRLWLFWAYMGIEGDAQYAIVCDNPEQEQLVWGEERKIGHNVMMNKPLVLNSGEWLLPISVWDKKTRSFLPDYSKERETGAFVYKTSDNGKTFTKLGKACAEGRSFDEHMVVELSDGKLMMLIRTSYGIGVSYSTDDGNSWSEPVDSKLKGPCTRFYIGKMPSGKYLLINHHNFQGRNNLTAFISDDDCKTFKYTLLLDERDQVSYPDVCYHNGFIYVVYDRERASNAKSLEEAYSCAREILYAKITEEDILSGKLVNKESSLKNVISKLGKYANESKDLYL